MDPGPGHHHGSRRGWRRRRPSPGGRGRHAGRTADADLREHGLDHRWPRRRLAAEHRRVRAVGRHVPGDAQRPVRRHRRRPGQDPRDDPSRRRRHQDRLQRRAHLRPRRPARAALHRGRGPGHRRDRRRPGPSRHVARARGRGDQAGRPRGRPLDRARDLPRRPGDRADAGTRDVAGADADGRRHHRGDRREPQGPRGHPGEVQRASAGRSWRPSSGPRRRASRSPWAPTAPSRRTGRTCASWS